MIMSATDGVLQLTSLGVAGAALRVTYNSEQDGESVYEPGRIQVGPEGMFLRWPDPPEDLEKAYVEWSNNPFMLQTFRCDCTVVERQQEGVELAFDRPAPAALQEWLAGMTAFLNRREPDAALKASKLYTVATVVSACGLLCGAMAILLPILVGDLWWVEVLSKSLLVLMLASIGGFAWIRALAGKEEIRAIGRGRG